MNSWCLESHFPEDEDRHDNHWSLYVICSCLSFIADVLSSRVLRRPQSHRLAHDLLLCPRDQAIDS